MRYLCIALSILVGNGFSHHVLAENLGTFNAPGATSTKKPDQDGAEALREQVKRKYETGEAQKVLKDMRDKNIDAILHPKPLPIKTSKIPETKFYSMDYVMPASAMNVQAGQRVNVLRDKGKLSDSADALLFIDGRDIEQVKFAVRQQAKMRLKIILTGGSPIEIGEQYKKQNNGQGIPFYFDQKGIIIKSLASWYNINITSVPAMISNGGNGNLRVDYGIN